GQPCSAEGPVLQKPLEAALEQAREESKPLYVAFLGEDWSLSCKRFRQNILSSEAFTAFAADEVLYYPVMARRKPPLTKEETAQLQALVIHFDIKSYPTFIILAPDGQELLRHGYKELSAGEYVALLRAVLP
ncbi:MAG: thioredoxin family protein, partial [Puniceicoccaceae bacterium]